MNLYAYVKGDPVNAKDPSGTQQFQRALFGETPEDVEARGGTQEEFSQAVHNQMRHDTAVRFGQISLGATATTAVLVSPAGPSIMSGAAVGGTTGAVFEAGGQVLTDGQVSNPDAVVKAGVQSAIEGAIQGGVARGQGTWHQAGGAYAGTKATGGSDLEALGAAVAYFATRSQAATCIRSGGRETVWPVARADLYTASAAEIREVG